MTRSPKRPVIGIPVGQRVNSREAKLYIAHQLYFTAICRRAAFLARRRCIWMKSCMRRFSSASMVGPAFGLGRGRDAQAYGAAPKHDEIEKTDPERDRVEMLLAHWAVGV